MRGSMKARLVLLALLAVLAASLAAGCGGGADDGGDAAMLAPPQAPVFIDFVVKPEGEMKANIDALAQSIAGVDDLGGLIASELEDSAAEGGESFDFEKEVEPWLGKRAGLFLREYDGEDFNGFGVAIETTDEGAAADFVDKVSAGEDEPARRGSYEGVDFRVATDDGTTFGVFDGFVALAETEAIFKAMVDASGGESLGGEAAYSDAVANLPADSAADVFVDVGGLIDESGGEIDGETQLFLDSVGIEPADATAVASLVPGSDHLEIDFSTNLSGDKPPSGDASQLLGELPADSIAALASAEFGDRFSEGIDRIDAEGVPGEIPPHQLKKALKQAGVDLDSIAGSVGDAGVFVQGSSETKLEGALVLEAEDAKQAKNTVSNLGFFLRQSGTPGVRPVRGSELTGFIVNSPDLDRPVLVAAKGERIAISYGTLAAAAGLSGDATLGETPGYKEAVAALGETPVAAFVAGPAALKLASTLIPPEDAAGFREAKPYLGKIDYLAGGSEASGGLATGKVIVGLRR